MTSTEAKWSARVSEWRASGQTAKEFCEGKDFTAGGLRYWSSRLRQGKEKATATEAVRIARVVRAESLPAPIDASLFVEVAGARVGVQRGFDPEVLRAVVAALGGGR
jgi:transposase